MVEYPQKSEEQKVIMQSYDLIVTCKRCGQSWPKKVDVEEVDVKYEAIKFLSDMSKNHPCPGLLGSWQVDWKPSK